MKRPDDDVLLKDMADHARMAVTAAAGKSRQDLDSDPVLAEALELFFETADKTEIEGRLKGEVFVTQLEVSVG